MDAAAPEAAPVLVPGAPVRGLVFEDGSTCALHTDGSRTCWGGRRGPRPQRGFEAQKTAEDRARRGCEVQDDHTVGCRVNPGDAPAPVTGVREVAEIAGRFEEHQRCGAMCARALDGSVTCWGNNERGQLGRGTIAPKKEWHTKPGGYCIQPSEGPEKVKGITEAAQIAGGEGFFCARLRSGKVACWGDLPGRKVRGTPEMIEGLSDVEQIVAGPAHLCALTRDERVLCLGGNFGGELGNGWAEIDGPHEVPGIDDAASVFASDTFSCAVSRTGAVSCWGLLEHGTRLRAVPEKLPLPGRAVQVSGLNMPCALLDSGELHCLKRGRFERVRAAPFTRVSVQYPDACGVSNGHVLCAEVPQYSVPQTWRAPAGFEVADAIRRGRRRRPHVRAAPRRIGGVARHRSVESVAHGAEPAGARRGARRREGDRLRRPPLLCHQEGRLDVVLGRHPRRQRLRGAADGDAGSAARAHGDRDRGAGVELAGLGLRGDGGGARRVLGLGRRAAAGDRGRHHHGAGHLDDGAACVRRARRWSCDVLGRRPARRDGDGRSGGAIAERDARGGGRRARGDQALILR
ncbi:MAG: hypothetical protein QM820_25855 [Minicystis sp.]